MRKKEFVDRLYDRVHAISIEDRQTGGVTRAGDPDDEWDRDDTYTDHNIEGFRAAPEEDSKYFDLVVPYEPEFDKEYYLLYAVYSTGDSFGHDDGSGIEYIGLYTENELDVARENLDRVKKHDNDPDGNFYVELLTPTGKTFQQHTPWIGYFEHLDYIEVEAVRRMK